MYALRRQSPWLRRARRLARVSLISAGPQAQISTSTPQLNLDSRLHIRLLQSQSHHRRLPSIGKLNHVTACLLSVDGLCTYHSIFQGETGGRALIIDGCPPTLENTPLGRGWLYMLSGAHHQTCGGRSGRLPVSLAFLSHRNR